MEETQSILRPSSASPGRKISILSFLILIILFLISLLILLFNIISIGILSRGASPGQPSPATYGNANNVFAKYVAFKEIKKGSLVSICDPKTGAVCEGMSFREMQTDMSVLNVPKQAVQSKTVMLAADQIDRVYGFFYIGLQDDGQLHVVVYAGDAIGPFFTETVFHNVLSDFSAQNLLDLKMLKQEVETDTFVLALALQSKADQQTSVHVVMIKVQINRESGSSQMNILRETGLYTAAVVDAISPLEATLTIFANDRIILTNASPLADSTRACMITTLQFARETATLQLVRAGFQTEQQCTRGISSCARDNSVFTVLQNKHIYTYATQPDGSVQVVASMAAFLYQNHPYENSETKWTMDKSCNFGYGLIRSLDNGVTMAALVTYDKLDNRFNTGRVITFPTLVSATDQVSFFMDLKGNFAYLFFREAFSRLNRVAKISVTEQVERMKGEPFRIQLPYFSKSIRLNTGRRMNAVASPVGTFIVLNDMHTTTNSMIVGIWSGGLRPVGIAQNDAEEGGLVTVQLKGISNVHRDLKPAFKYFGDYGAPHVEDGEIAIGTAISPSELLMREHIE